MKQKIDYKCSLDKFSKINYLLIIMKLSKIHLVLILLVIEASCSNIRYLADNSDNCAKYAYLDKEGKLH